MSAADPGAALARELVHHAVRAGLGLATAESLTGGAVAAAIVSVPGVSAVYRGGVIAYAADLKQAWLGVPDELLSARGTVDPEVASAMAEGIRRATGAAVGLATTGVAGPGPAEGHPAGTVHVAVSAPGGTRVRSLALPGDREAVRRGTVEAVLGLAVDTLTSPAQ